MAVDLVLIFLLIEAAACVSDLESHHACQQFTADKEIKNLIESKQKLIEPCPCVRQKIELDYSYEKIGDCYRQWYFVDGVKQMCCYSPEGHIQVGAPHGGYMLFETLWKNISAVQRSCCLEEATCDLFYKINPSDDCSAYKPPTTVTSYGDPTIQTIDGNTFDFNGHGEYVFLNTSDLEIQVRLGYVTPGNNDATLFEVFSIFDKATNDTFEVQLNRSEKIIHVYQHSAQICNSSIAAAPKPCIIPPPRGHCTVLAGGGKAVILGCGVVGFAQNIAFTAGDLMSVEIASNNHSKVLNISGLVGHQMNGTFVYRNGTEVDANSSASILFDYGESWSLEENESDSHFDYSLTDGNFTFYNGHHTRPRFLEDLVGNLTALFEGYPGANISLFNETCRNYWDNTPNEQCLLTIARSQDYDLGLAVMATVNKTRHRWEINHNKSPNFTEGMPNNIRAVYNQTTTIKLKEYVWDESLEQLHYLVETKLPEKEFILENGTFIWNVGTGLRYIDTSFTFYVIDQFNSSASHQVKITYCGCDDPSECSFHIPNKNYSVNLIKAGCECPDYFTGLYCETELDACNDFRCFQNCSKAFDRSIPSWPCAPCPKGRQGVIASYNQTCQNIDECAPGYIGEDKCEQNCTDTDGSFICTCREGYSLNADKHSCDDVDECKLDHEVCKETEICLNTIGHYECPCLGEYSRKTPGAECTKTVGYAHVGSIGFTIAIKDDVDADNINKTVDTPENRITLGQQLDARFNGTPGYLSVEVVGIIMIKASANRRKRQNSQSYKLNVDYVVHWNTTADSEALTKSLQQSLDNYSNTTGFKINGLSTSLKFQTADIKVNSENETGLCEISSQNDCDIKSTTCKDDNGRIECPCKAGYKEARLSKKYCEDIDECPMKSCSGLGKCRNTFGGYICKCEKGYAANTSDPWNIACEDIDECSSDEYKCKHGTCNNTIGDWDCTCNGSGFFRTGLKPVFVCNDIDECSNTSYHCGNGVCNNGVGNWSCTCWTGYRRNETSANDSYIQCEDIDECKEFETNNSSGERCIHGKCENTPGSWECNCPANRTWQNVSNGTYPIYRCQGDYQYIGEIKLLWIHQTVQKEQVENFLNETITLLFLGKEDFNKSIHRGSLRMADIFLNVEVFNITRIDGGGFITVNASYILHLGESVTPEWVEQFQKNVFNVSKRFKGAASLVASSILDESGTNLCNIPNRTDCDLESTNCSVNNGSYSCTCKSGFHVRIDDHHCKDIDECQQKAVLCESGNCSNTVGSWECLCNDTSNFIRINNSYGICEDINECNDTNYSCNSGYCEDWIGGWNCTCDAGYSLHEIVPNKNFTCTDIDECSEKHGVTCSNGGSCVNSPGNWTCECLSGFEIHYMNESFIDCHEINECLRGATCSNGGTCVNIQGNWTCECPHGFEIHHINESFIDCHDINECNDTNFQCISGNCKNTDGVWNCICRTGYHPQEIVPGKIYSCTDIDECDENHDVSCLNGGKCSNIPGNWTCNCPSGYEIHSINASFIECEDKNECNHTDYSCSSGHCENGLGTWNCTCDTGYNRQTIVPEKVYTCTDIDECTNGNVTCSNGGSCVNIPGKWTCECPPGFERRENTSYLGCLDINECNSADYSCEGDNNSAHCKNVHGSWECNCTNGYRSRNVSETARICEDINECDEGHVSCNGGECKNTAGSWYCECPDGFANLTDKSKSNTITCSDINECVTLNISCIEASACVNTNGSWKCICSEGLTEKTINKTSKLCGGDYQYVASVSFTLTGEITDVATIEIEIKKKILAMYIDSFEESDVWIEILKITGLPGYSRKRRSVPDVHDIQTEYIVHTKEEKTEEQLNNVETVYRAKKCNNETKSCFDDIGGFTMQLAEVQTKNSSAICDTTKNVCDKATSTCFSTNGQLECNCSQGYTKPDMNSLRCIDVDECKSADACPNTTTCSNKEGTWDCSCKDGLKAIETETGKKKCRDPCKYSECHKSSTCSHENNDDGYICGCEKGRKGKYCKEIDYEYKDSEQQTMLIALGSSLGGLVLILSGVIFGVCRFKRRVWILMRLRGSAGTFGSMLVANALCLLSRGAAQFSKIQHRWRAAKVKEAEKISMRHVDTNGIKNFDSSFLTDQYLRNSRDGGGSLYGHRLSNVSIPRVQSNGDIHRNHNGHIPNPLYARPEKLPKPNFRGSMPNLANGDANFYHSDSRRYSDQYPKRFSSYDEGLNTSDSAPRNFYGRTSPTPDYNRPSSPKPDYRRQRAPIQVPKPDYNRPRSPVPDYRRLERHDASRDSGMGNGNSSDSNEFRRPDQGRGYSHAYRHSDTRF